MKVSTKTERIAMLKRMGVDSSKHYLHVHGVDAHPLCHPHTHWFDG